MAIGSMSAGCQYNNSEQGVREQQAFVHPGLMQTEEDLALMKKKIDTDEEPWRTAWDNLLNESYSSLDFIPEPRAHIVRGSYGSPNIGADEFSNSGKAAYSHALQWYVTGEQANANKAIEILNAWSDKLWDFQQNDAKILVGWTGSDFINTAEILRYTDSGWTEEDMIEFERMLRTIFYPLIKDFFPEANGNWDAAMMHTMISMGVYLDDHGIFNRAVNHYLRGSVNAGITKYIYPHGQSQESTRDQPHTQMGLDYLSRTAHVAWNQGVDLYESADNRLALGFEYTAKYMLGNEVFTYGGPISTQGRDRFRDNFEATYQHYHYVKGLEMPYTWNAIDSTRTTGLEVRDSRFDTSPWGSGVDVTHSHDVEIINSETARNRLYGIRIAESENIRVLENLVEGNDGGGIMFDVLMDGNRNIEVTGNIVQNNGGKGVIINEGTGDTVQDNILRDNGHFDNKEASKAAFYY